MNIEKQLETAVRTNHLVLVVFYADWSPHYEWIGPVLRTYEKRTIELVRVNVGEDKAIADAHNIDGATGLDYHMGVIKKHPEWIKEAHDLGLKVNVWTVDETEEMKWLIEQKVDFITTNEPVVLLEELKKNK